MGREGDLYSFSRNGPYRESTLVPIINGLGKLLLTFKREISIALQITQ